MTTLLAGLTAAIALAVTQGWNWPLLGGYRWGVGALAVLGLASGCGSGVPMRPDVSTWSLGDPFIWVASALGVAALGLIVAGLVIGTQELFVALAAVLLALWLVATARHAFGRLPGGAMPRAAGQH